MCSVYCLRFVKGVCISLGVKFSFFSIVSVLLRHKRNHLLACAESCIFTCWQEVVPTASCELVL